MKKDLLKSKYLIKLTVAGMLALANSLSWANSKPEVINVATDVWEGYTNKDGSGLYHEVLNRIYARSGTKVDVRYMPYGRSVVTLLHGEADLTTGNYRDTFKKEWYADCPLVKDNIDIAVNEDLYQQWQGPQTLKGKRIVSSYGMDFNQYFQLADTIYSEVRSNELMVKMLVSGRTDAIIHYRKDIRSSYKKLGKDDYHIIPGVFTMPSYFVFYDSPTALAYKEIFDREFKKLIRSGEWRKLIIKYLNDDSYYPDYSQFSNCL